MNLYLKIFWAPGKGSGRLWPPSHQLSPSFLPVQKVRTWVLPAWGWKWKPSALVPEGADSTVGGAEGWGEKSESKSHSSVHCCWIFRLFVFHQYIVLKQTSFYVWFVWISDYCLRINPQKSDLVTQKYLSLFYYNSSVTVESLTL